MPSEQAIALKIFMKSDELERIGNLRLTGDFSPADLELIRDLVLRVEFAGRVAKPSPLSRDTALKNKPLTKD